jgi:hemerythrin-like domain-containing protein
MDATSDLKIDHVTIRRVRDIAKKCSDLLYSNKEVPFEDLEIISVVIEEFVDRYHHGKEENAYFPQTSEKNGFSEDIRKFLIEHELGRRIAKMLRDNIIHWKNGIDAREPVARFLKSYAVFITDHTGKEDKFFDDVVQSSSLSDEDDEKLQLHYKLCMHNAGGRERIDELIVLIKYLEERDWMNGKRL